jgi:integrase/recombinase XerC
MVFKHFIEYSIIEKNHSCHTVAAYERDLLQFTLFLKQQDILQIQDVNHSVIRSWVTYLLEKGDSRRTVNRKISTLKSYFKFLLKIGDITSSPVASYKSLKTSKKVQIPFSIEEVVQLLDTSYDNQDFTESRNMLMIEFLYATGVRRDELICLKVSDIDLSGNIIKVLGKGNKERLIPLVQSIHTHVKQYLLLRRRIAQLNTDAFFVTVKGVKIHPSLVYRVVKSYFSTVSLKVKISPHVLRHTFATHLLDNGADLNAVKELLGHESLSSTQVYTHSSMGILKEVYKNTHPRSKTT